MKSAEFYMAKAEQLIERANQRGYVNGTSAGASPESRETWLRSAEVYAKLAEVAARAGFYIDVDRHVQVQDEVGP